MTFQTRRGTPTPRTFLMLVLLLSLFGGNSASAQPESSASARFRGVWAGPNCELVATGKFWILFEQNDNTISATLQTFEFADSTVTFDTRAVVVFDTTGQEVTIKAKDLVAGDELLVDTDSNNTIELGRRTFVVEDAPKILMIKYDGRVRKELWNGHNRLGMFSGDRWLIMEPAEKLVVVDPYDPPKAKKKNTGRCLQEWPLGSRLMKDGAGRTIGVEVITNRHSYVFTFSPMVYCRAARIRSDNNGMVFAQNIRLMRKPAEFTAVMAENNLKTAGEPLTIVDSLFDPKVCVYTDDEIYWSLKKRSKEEIILNGCGGEDYIHRRPKKDAADRLEWFAYEKYAD